jgi:hypothetical protein
LVHACISHVVCAICVAYFFATPSLIIFGAASFFATFSASPTFVNSCAVFVLNSFAMYRPPFVARLRVRCDGRPREWQVLATNASASFEPTRQSFTGPTFRFVALAARGFAEGFGFFDLPIVEEEACSIDRPGKA